ncbi:uncharacterized protein MKK02DRAFT_31959 [Dioszegia hungarica]|uniref:Uncharacterized protein n=1 Tax=Dioszegia hungarica TaxID=4972 RepID=A0AA38LWN3_9TREE|nr:uncharacterized protein MKK02DRAFT_31959 [Dioszegia hungarica]KAI9638535.1 hypothetical protein MKK02DRAFT_31959 [Dioszegia hungarica]
MSTTFYSPSRPAPAPPCSSRPYNELPADHPFLNPYTPRQLPRSTSCSSLDSVYTQYTIQTPPIFAPLHVKRAYTTSPASGYYPDSLSRSAHSPSTWVASPTPVRSTRLAHSHHIPRPSKPFNQSPTRSFIPLPTELSILDARPRGNLLADLEFIAGKKLHFPFLQWRRASQEDKEVKKAGKKEKRGSAGGKSEKTSSPARLTKERRKSEEEEYLFEVGMMRKGRAGRGVREGNWV